MAEEMIGPLKITDENGNEYIEIWSDGSGQIKVKNSDERTTIVIDGQGYGGLVLGTGPSRDNESVSGNLIGYNSGGKRGFEFDGESGFYTFRDKEGNNIFQIDSDTGKLVLGSRDRAGRITLQNSDNRETIILKGEEGDIELLGADCAEEFSLLPGEDLQQGSVLIMHDENFLTACHQAYDKKVAGVISGGGDFKPGLVLDKKVSSEKRAPVALMGKVFCLVDAKWGSIKVGDLLTTSTTPGHAMKAKSSSKAFGAVLGKSLRNFSKGRGLIPILVGLQ